jgi:hypothetical protein
VLVGLADVVAEFRAVLGELGISDEDLTRCRDACRA